MVALGIQWVPFTSRCLPSSEGVRLQKQQLQSVSEAVLRVDGELTVLQVRSGRARQLRLSGGGS